MADIKFEVTKHIGVLSEGSKGWRKELNLISWNDREPKYDIRDWSPEREKMGKGVTLSEGEVSTLKILLSEYAAKAIKNTTES
ncbi:MAG: YdbC family protein [Defluviitaleaceae bacterium]|nr:YdbC family protein [Defluviitaleaceae bacterium]